MLGQPWEEKRYRKMIVAMMILSNIKQTVTTRSSANYYADIPLRLVSHNLHIFFSSLPGAGCFLTPLTFLHPTISSSPLPLLSSSLVRFGSVPFSSVPPSRKRAADALFARVGDPSLPSSVAKLAAAATLSLTRSTQFHTLAATTSRVLN
ncbi:hypothetical protein R1flu_019039 [Riccia fluitans]|uniref:Uncharacterized protein n=1 Tax=Riccia fluitans TaxID=41844 RepID=A0ABD1ZHJ0_9MARC